MTYLHPGIGGSHIHVDRDATEPDGTPVIAITTSSRYGQGPFVQVPLVQVPLVQVEELVAGIRDAARQASTQQPKQPPMDPAAILGIAPDWHATGEQDATQPTTDERPLTDDDRQLLTFALDLAFDAMTSTDGFTDDDHAALARLRRLAAGAES